MIIGDNGMRELRRQFNLRLTNDKVKGGKPGRNSLNSVCYKYYNRNITAFD